MLLSWRAASRPPLPLFGPLQYHRVPWLSGTAQNGKPVMGCLLVLGRRRQRHGTSCECARKGPKIGRCCSPRPAWHVKPIPRRLRDRSRRGSVRTEAERRMVMGSGKVTRFEAIPKTLLAISCAMPLESYPVLAIPKTIDCGIQEAHT